LFESDQQDELARTEQVEHSFEQVELGGFESDKNEKIRADFEHRFLQTVDPVGGWL
jgi:hypothetical protein